MNTFYYYSEVTSSGPTATDIFVTNAGITNLVQKAALQQLENDLKSNNFWTRFKAIYPFVGETEQAQTLNFVDPRNEDAAFRLTMYSDAVSHSVYNAKGMKMEKTYANTHFNGSLHFNPGLGDHISIYVQSRPVAERGDIIDMGSYGGDNHHLITGYDPDLDAGLSEYHGNYTSFKTPHDGVGFYMLSGMGTNTQGFYYENGKNLGSVLLSSTGSPNLPMYIGTLSLNGSAYQLSTRQYSFSSIGDYFNDADSATLYTIIQKYQTALGRAI